MQCARCTNALPEGVTVCPVCGWPGTANSSVPQGTASPASVGYTFQEFQGVPTMTPVPGPPPTPYLYSYPPVQAGPYAYYPVPPGVPAPVQAKRGVSVGVIVLCVILAFVVIFAGVGVLVYSVASRAATHKSTATLTSGGTSGPGTASSDSTTRDAAMKLYQQITSQPPALTYDLTDPSLSNWHPYQYPTYGCGVQNDGLHIHISDSGRYFYCTDGASHFPTGAFQLQMKILSGNGGGLIFHVNPSTGGFYGMLIRTDGNYQVFHSNADQSAPTTLASGLSSAYKSQLCATNELTVITQGGHQFDLFINGQFVVEVQDASYSGGDMGALADDDTQPSEVIYTQEKIWVL